MIAGDANQLNSSNVRYRVTITTDNTKDWLKPAVYQQNSDGSFTDNLVKSSEYYDGYVVYTYTGKKQWEREDRIELTDNSRNEDAVYLRLDRSVFGSDRVKVYEGTLNRLDEIGQAAEITDEIFNGQGYQSQNRYVYITIVSFGSDGKVTGFLPCRVWVRTTSEFFSFQILNANGEYCGRENTSNRTGNNCTYELFKGYSAEQQYYLQAWHFINGIGNSVSNGVTVFKGLYNTIEEARSSNAEDITSVIFENGYPDYYSQGVDFTFFVNGKVFQYNIKTVESDRQPTLNINAEFHVYGVNDANGQAIKSYCVQTDEDSYAENNYLTILVDKDADLTNLALLFSVSEDIQVYCEGSSSPEESGKTLHDFSNGIMQYTVSGKSREYTANYWIQVVKSDVSGSRLYINSLMDAGAKTEVRDGVVYTTREVMLDGLHNYVHDILLANMGNIPISKISVELDSDVLEIDPYWTLDGSQNLGTFNSSEINNDKQYGELSNLAKIRLRQKAGVQQGTDITGTLKVKEEGRDILVINLTGIVGNPFITTTEIPNAVRYVPYDMMFQNNNNYDQNNVTYSLQKGSELPEGMELKPNGELYGVPKETGTFHIIVRMDSSISDLGVYLKEYDFIVLDNTDENVNNVTEVGYELSTKLSPIPSSSDYIVVSEGPYSEFKNVYIDGDKLERGVDYEAESGSTRITIRSETLSKKGPGSHTLGIEFRKGGKDTGKLIRVAQNYNAEDIGVVQKPSSGNANNNTVNNGAGNNNTDSSVNSNTESNQKSNNSSESSNVAVEAVPVPELLKEGYIILQIDVSKDGVLRAEILNQYAGQKVYLNVIFSTGFGMTIDMFEISFVSEDIKISYSLLSDIEIAPEFDVVHAIPNGIKPLGFDAIFNFHIGDVYIGKKAYIYVLNESGIGYDLVGTTIVNEIGNIAFISEKVTDVIIFVEK